MMKDTDRRQQKRKEATMLADIRIIQTHAFIKATPEGRLGRENMKKLFIDIASVAATSNDCGILIDTRKAESGMSSSDLWYLAAQLSKLGKSFSRKTALLCPRERFDRVGFFALCAQNRGFLVNVFTSFEDAIEWLMAEGP
ncbi:MAG TPA: hypothetical protein VN836_06275 [Verrucomicrobiae bacterium]|nr:hypothetical protein [Verrucomicrobiae bacterium]